MSFDPHATEPDGENDSQVPYSQAWYESFRKSLGEDVADRLREAILHGELSPGQRLREEELSERLRVSRAPVRAGFVLLQIECVTYAAAYGWLAVRRA